MKLIWILLNLTLMELCFAHNPELTYFSEILFDTKEKRHCYSANSKIHFNSIGLQSKIFTSGPNSTTFPPEYGVTWLKTVHTMSAFIPKNGFEWGTFRYPDSFELEFEQVTIGEYSGKALSKPNSAPWFAEDYSIKIELRSVENQTSKVLHEEMSNKFKCFVEYLGAGLKDEKLNSQNSTLDSCLCLIRAVIALENFSIDPLAVGHYELVVEFRNDSGLLLSEGSYFFEVVPEQSSLAEKNIIASIQIPEQIEDYSQVLGLILKDAQGNILTSLPKQYIRDIAIHLKKEGGEQDIKDNIAQNFRWSALPPNIKPQLPLKLELNKAWINFFRDGVVHCTFTITREYLKEETITVSGKFTIKVE